MESNTNQQILVIDCQLAGISGDMMAAALLDLGADTQKVLDAMRSTRKYLQGCDQLDVNVIETKRCGFRAKQIKIKTNDNIEHRSGSEIIQAVIDSAKSLDLSLSAKVFVEDTIRTLVEAEARLHGKSINKVALHEGGSIDTVADIIGVATALDYLKFFRNTKIYSTSIAVGGGLFRFSHGIVASPAPATLEILLKKRFTIVGGPLDFELSTPTGAAILTNLAEKSLAYFPAIQPKAVGYGAGEKDFDNVPNILRVISSEKGKMDFTYDHVVLLETNLDDVTGETIGYAMEKLLSVGAKDVSVTPIFEKKSRPAWIMSVVSEEKDIDTLVETLTSETGTLGVRVYPCHRKILLRENKKIEIDIMAKKTEVNFKIAKDNSGRIVNLKPEYEDIRDLALNLELPFRKIHADAIKQARKKLGID